MTRQVEFAETDMAGIVHFVNFFRWMESCETAFYRSLELPLISFVPGQVVGWPRVNVSCTYRAPLRFNDTVEVTLFVKKLGTRSVTYLFQFHQAAVLVAAGEVTAVCGRGRKRWHDGSAHPGGGAGQIAGRAALSVGRLRF